MQAHHFCKLLARDSEHGFDPAEEITENGNLSIQVSNFT